MPEASGTVHDVPSEYTKGITELSRGSESFMRFDSMAHSNWEGRGRFGKAGETYQALYGRGTLMCAKGAELKLEMIIHMYLVEHPHGISSAMKHETMYPDRLNIIMSSSGFR